MYVEKNTGIRAKMAEGRNQMLSLSFDKRVCVAFHEKSDIIQV
jgi:hypothetical protein